MHVSCWMVNLWSSLHVSQLLDLGLFIDLLSEQQHHCMLAYFKYEGYKRHSNVIKFNHFTAYNWKLQNNNNKSRAAQAPRWANTMDDGDALTLVPLKSPNVADLSNLAVREAQTNVTFDLANRPR